MMAILILIKSHLRIFIQTDIFFSYATDIDSTELYDEEAKVILPEVFRYKPNLNKRNLLFVKIHDAFGYNLEQKPIIPGEATCSAIYFIRYPLDIIGSLASHNDKSINYAVNFICSKEACFAPQPDNWNYINQFRQFLCDWSSHVNSWTLQTHFPIHIIRYEDMITNTFSVFKNIVINIIGWNQ